MEKNSKQSWKEAIGKSSPKIIAIGLLVGSGYIINIFKGKDINANEVLILIGLIVALIVVHLFQVYIISHSKNEQLKKIIGRFDSILAEREDWFYSHKRLAGVEKDYCNDNLRNIWVASSNLEYEQGDSPFVDSIKDNLREGINYYYIIPKAKYDDLKICVEGLEEFSKTTKGKIKFIPVKDKSLFLFLSNIVIYKTESQPPNAYKELLIDKNPFNRGWMKVSESNPDFGNLYSKFKEHVANN
ncbi:MAG: hypothetical protein AAF489_14285 [Bacteroidota bacterium]